MLNDLRCRLRSIFRAKAMDAELDEEIGFHIQQQADVYLRTGLNQQEAMRRARIALTGVEQVKEDCRDARGVALWDTTVRDVRYAFRQQLRNPALSLAIILTLGIGMGATTALFTVANAVLLRDLAVRDPRSLVMVDRDPARLSVLHSFPEYLQIRDQSQAVFTGVAAFNSGNAAGFSTPGAAHREVPEVVSIAFVSGSYFEVLGLSSHAGRVLSRLDDNASAEDPPVVLSYEFWRRRLGGDFASLGQPVRLNGAVCTVVGIAARNFTGTIAGIAPDVYVPLRAFPAVLPLMRNNWNAPRRQWLSLVARLKPGISLGRATAQIDLLAGDRRQSRTVLLPVQHAMGPLSPVSQPLLILLAASALLLALACANVAGLLLARSIHRQREIALRVALGAGRLRLIRQLLTESLLLALCGGVAGLLVGMSGARALVQFLPADGRLPFSIDVSPDARVFGFAFGISLLTGLLFGLAPALRASRWDPAATIKGSPAAKGAAGWLRMDLRSALVVGQVSLSIVLLVGVALLARSLVHLQALDPGFSRAGTLFVYAEPSQFGYQGQRASQFYEHLRERIAALPGVTRTSLADYAPLDGGNDSGTVTAPGAEAPIPVEKNTVSDGYLRTIGIPLVAGRDLLQQDAQPGAPHVALVSESLARLLFRNENPLGRRLSIDEPYQAGNSFQIAGVVRDAHYFGLREKPAPMVYTPLDPVLSRLVICARIAGDPRRMIPAIRRELAAMDPAVPVLEAATITARVDRENAQPRLLAVLLGAFGSMALVLAAIGLYGVLAFGVASRTREIGIRSALGAPRSDAVKRVFSEVWMLVGVGALLGSVASLATVRLLNGFLFGVQPMDARSFAAAIAVLALAASLAAYVPARRAAKIEPSIALRHE